MKVLIKKIFLITLFTLLLIEFFSFLSIKFNIVRDTLPSWVTLHAHEEYTHWHPKNITFKNIAGQCWVSTVSYNNYGMRGVDNVSLKKKKRRIALLGDSMIENIELSDGLDIGSKIKTKIPNYEILNFSARATGLADQTDIYNKLVKKFDVDTIFLFVHYNDLINNSIDGNASIYHRRYDYQNNQVVEIDKDYQWLKNYNSKLKYFKRNYSVHLKGTNFYKVYLHVIGILNNKKKTTNDTKVKKKIIKKNKNDYEPYFEKNKKIYEFLKDKFISDMEPNQNLYVILNIFPFSFVDNDKLNEEEKFIKKKVMPFLQKTWSDVNFIYPLDYAEEYILVNKLKYPYFSWDCDKHYSIHGSEFISDLVYKKINMFN